MSTISSVGIDSTTTSSGGNGLGDVDLDQFLQLLITELQNQDPLNPMENSELVEQIGQIREIGATNLLTETLNTFLNGQSLTTASSMIGKEIVALSDAGEEVRGVIERVSVEPDDDNEQRDVRMFVGEQSIQLDNIRQIVGSQ